MHSPTNNREPATDQIDLYIKYEGSLKPRAMALSMLEAQAMMDRLWKVGLRPTEAQDHAGALSATERHLKDLQKLVFPQEIGSFHDRMDT